eukprot:scaffold68557_cov65-Phaeocystis_antarctica.AAC.3
MSAPAAKALLPLPVTTMAPISGSASNSLAAATSSFVRVGVSAFSCFSRLSVMSPTPPGRLSVRISLYAAPPLLHQRALAGDHLAESLRAIRFMMVRMIWRSAVVGRGGSGGTATLRLDRSPRSPESHTGVRTAPHQRPTPSAKKLKPAGLQPSEPPSDSTTTDLLSAWFSRVGIPPRGARGS